MRKTSNKSFLASATYLVVAFVLCAGIILYTGNGGTGFTVADITETMPDTGTDEIVAGNEEVPLAGAPKVSVKKTTKTTTKKKKLKKAAKKTATVTKKKTSKKKSTTKSASEQTVKETTVQTTEKTSTKKKSKVQTIQTTVVTTIKTTTQTFGTTTSNKNSASGATSTAASSSGFAISQFSDIKGHVDSKVYDAFVNLGFELKINSALSTTGVFSTQNHNIQLKRGQSSYLLHELGHFVSALKGRSGKKIDQSADFTSIYNAEKSAYVGNNKAYVTQDAGEYFAESFRDYTENPSALKSQRPKTYSYINQMVSSLSSSDVNAFRNAYGWYWNIKK